MATKRKFRHEDIAEVPRGWRVRTKREADGTEVRIAFPPGRRKKGAGKLISILHPTSNPVSARLQWRGRDKKTGKWRTLKRKYASESDALRGMPRSLEDIQLVEVGKGGHVRSGILSRNPSRKKNIDWATASTGLISGAGAAIGAGIAGALMSRSKKKKNRRNGPDEAARDLYASFHGRAPSEIIELQEEVVRSGDYYALGDMGGLWLHPVKGDPSKWGKADVEFNHKDDVKLAASPENSQLYLIGGNQELPREWLQKLGADLEKQFIPLGTVYGISYITEKAFDGFERSEYAHELGEETGERPTAFYDQRSKRILLAGGHYYIAPDTASLGMSPGIVN